MGWNLKRSEKNRRWNKYDIWKEDQEYGWDETRNIEIVFARRDILSQIITSSSNEITKDSFLLPKYFKSTFNLLQVKHLYDKC